MLNTITSSDSTKVIIDIIRQLTGGTTFAKLKATISACINGQIIIKNQIIEVMLTYSRPNYALIDILWEDYGYNNYQDMGLFGRMSTQWQQVKQTSENEFTVYGANYEITIEYQNPNNT